jgi:hypothetical protein
VTKSHTKNTVFQVQHFMGPVCFVNVLSVKVTEIFIALLGAFTTEIVHFKKGAKL